ncbi:MAG: hypothetical protein KDD10_11365 [Phaeodactylibacter sp.]|nr:hypothetical protein [Phaeodactylibacter sp.]MCB9295006.1 hypothetical protein [Lewinellaceae bacterium]
MSKRSGISKAIQGLTTLGAFVETELNALEKQYGPFAREAGERVLESLLSEEGTPLITTEGELSKELAARGTKASAVSQAIESFLQTGMIARPRPGTLRLGNNTLAAALEQRFRDQRTLRREALALIRDKYRQNDLLTEKELNRVEPVRPHLNLTTEEDNFLRRSERAVKRRKWALWMVIASVILTLLWLSWNWYNESTVANREKARADEKAEEALISAEAAHALRMKAIGLADSLRVEKDTSEVRRLRAELSEAEARLQAFRARQAARLAEKQEAIARRLADTLSMQLDTVSKYRALAEADRQAAVDSAASAEKARRQAEALALILKSRNIALSVPQLAKDSVERKAILAYQAYAINRDNDQGDVYNSDVYKALCHALEALQEERGFLTTDKYPNVHDGAVAGIIEGGDELYFSAGTDGKIYSFGKGFAPRSKLYYPLGYFPEVVQKMTKSADTRWVMVCPRFGQLYLYQAHTLLEVMAAAITPSSEQIELDKRGYDQKCEYGSRWGATDAVFISEPDAFLVVGHAGNVLKQPVGKPGARAEKLFKEDHPFRSITLDGNTLYLLDQDGRLMAGLMNQIPASVKNLRHLGSGYAALAAKGGFFAGGKQSGEVVLAAGIGSASPDDFLAVAHSNQWHQAAVMSAQFSPDGRWLATISRDGVLRLTDVPRYFREAATYQPILLDMKDSYVTAICFSSDNQKLLAGTKEGSIRNFYLNPEHYARQICELLHLKGEKVDWQTPWRKDFQEKSEPKKCY